MFFTLVCVCCLHHAPTTQVAPLASTFALLRIPKTPEVRKLIGQGTKGEAVKIEGFVPSTVDPAAVPVCGWSECVGEVSVWVERVCGWSECVGARNLYAGTRV